MKLGRPVLIAASMLFAAGVHAQDSGFYLGGALGRSKLQEWCDTSGSTTITLTSCQDTDSAWKLLGGYRFNRHIAAEASYVRWGEVTASTNTGVDVSAEQYSYGLAVVGTLPLGAGFEVFGKAGFVMTEQETRRIRPNPSTVNRDETEVHYGFGARYAFTKNVALRGEWENTDKLKVDMLSIGVEYRF